MVGTSATTKIVEGLLFDVSPLDPMTFGGTGLVLLIVTLIAAFIPAFRAATMDPAGALRNG